MYGTDTNEANKATDEATDEVTDEVTEEVTGMLRRRSKARLLGQCSPRCLAFLFPFEVV
jgi:hypothetical protein